jgi:hypothetical protein
MYPRFERCGSRLSVSLTLGRRVGATVRSERVGVLGRVTYSEPISVDQRVKFWAAMSQRFLALRVRRPGLISEADEVKVRNQIAKRIPRPSGAEELQLFRQATAVQDMKVALERLERGEDAAEEAMRQLLRLAKETQPNLERSA